MQTITTQKLNQHKQNNLTRYRHCNANEQIDFCSNDYLGLAKHPRVIQAAQNALSQYGVGSKASPLVSGYHMIHQRCEEALAEFLGCEKAILFNSGYAANLGSLQALGDPSLDFFIDKLCHASLIQGSQLSKSTFYRYPHNRIQTLSTTMQQSKNEKMIITDGVFSSTGSIAPLKEIMKIAKLERALTFIDDAHGIGILGKHGRGSLEHHNIKWNESILLSCALGKAFGSAGAVIAGSKTLIHYLEQFARTYMFSTALPPSMAAATEKSLEIMQAESWRRETLHDHIQYFATTAANHGVPTLQSSTAIQSICVGDAKKTLAIQAYLKTKGFWVAAFRPPSVPPKQSLIRISLHTQQQKKQIEKLIIELKNAL